MREAGPRPVNTIPHIPQPEGLRMSENPAPSPLEAETSHETTTFDHFDLTWTVPTKRHLSHIKRMTDEIRTGIYDYNTLVAETMLSADDFAALMEIDPDEVQLDAFIADLVKAMGLGSSGNSKPSSASS